MTVIDTVTSASFDSDVVERSRTQPVVVDFWAPWCGPCHQLSPLLERVAERYAGDVAVVKLNVDENPDIAQRYRVQGIPAVKAYQDGEVAAEFTGVQPETAIERFFATLVPSEADKLVAAAGDDPDPEPRLRQALATEPGHAGAVVALARVLAGRGETEEASALLERVPGDPAAGRLRAEIGLASQHVDEEGMAELRSRADAGDPEARLALGRALAASGDYEKALEALLGAVAHPRTREDARQAALEVFDVLGSDDERVRSARPKLASALYA